MFRNAMTEFSLHGARKASAPRPSFQPAVEALEERVVLNGSMMPAPTFSEDTALVLELTAGVKRLTHSLDNAIRNAVSARNPALLPGLVGRAGRLGIVVGSFNAAVDSLEQGHDLSDLTFAQAVARFRAAVDAFEVRAVIVATVAHEFHNF